MHIGMDLVAIYITYISEFNNLQTHCSKDCYLVVIIVSSSLRIYEMLQWLMVEAMILKQSNNGNPNEFF